MAYYAGESKAESYNMVSDLSIPRAQDTQPNIGAQYGHLDQSISRLRETFDNLETRLSPILTPSEPTADSAKDAKPVRNESPFAESIRKDSERIEAIILQMSSVLMRLEL